MSDLKWQAIDFARTEIFLKLSGRYQEIYSQAVFGEIVKFHARELGVDLAGETLQAYSNQARRALGLHKKADFDQFLTRSGADYELWESVCQNELCRTILRNNYSAAVEYIPDAWPMIKSLPGVKEAVSEIIIAKALSAGIELSEQSVQNHSDNLRRISRLHKKNDLEAYLKAINLDYNGWEKMVKAELYRAKLIAMNIPPLTSSDLALNQQISASISAVISELVYGHLLKTSSEKLGITVSEEEMQQYLNDFRRVNNLHSAKLFTSWLAANSMNLDDFEIIADLKIRTAKFKQSGKAAASPEKIRAEVRLSVAFIEAALRLARESSILKKENVAASSEDDLQKESDSLRRAFHLHSAGQFNVYLEQNKLSPDAWQDYLEHRLQVRNLKNRVASDAAIISYLNKNRVARKSIKDEIFNKYLANQL